VPFSEPFRDPSWPSRRSERSRPKARPWSSSHASCHTRSGERRPKVLTTSSPLCASHCPCIKAWISWAFRSLGAIFCSIREFLLLGVGNRVCSLITSPRSASRPLPTFYRNLRPSALLSFCHRTDTRTPGGTQRAGKRNGAQCPARLPRRDVVPCLTRGAAEREGECGVRRHEAEAQRPYRSERDCTWR
jgi:hypothetical protein